MIFSCGPDDEIGPDAGPDLAQAWHALRTEVATERIGTGQRWGTLVLTVADGAAAYTGPISVKCTATTADKTVAHDARPAAITWSVQANNNTPTITRLERQLMLAVRPDKAPMKVAVDLPDVLEIDTKNMVVRVEPSVTIGIYE